MCGFSGFLSGVPDVDGLVNLKRMGQLISHRGPDDEGQWIDDSGCVGFAHRRLAIVDLSPAGAQPMHSACERYVIAFNGEIYNHLSLREQLGSGHHWRGHSDTETLLACFVAWGMEKTLQATVGMFALALWDKQTGELVLARDRMGEKPLYWGWQNETLLFGSELKSLKSHPSFEAAIDRDALALFLRHNYIPAPHSIYRGINKLLPGHYLTISKNQSGFLSQSKAYWSMNAVIQSGLNNPFVGSDAQGVSTLEGLIAQSVAGQMLADVPLGAFLSGGVDSSTIVALMQQASDKPVRTFTIGFNEDGYDEAGHAEAVARHLKTEHTELYVGAQEALALIPQLPTIYCEPFADSSQIPTFLVSQMARQHVTVSLSGDAGDELFGGYNPYQFAPRIWAGLNKLPLALRRLAVKVVSGIPLPGKLDKLLEVFPASDRQEFYRLLVSHWKSPERVVIGAGDAATLFTLPDSVPATDSFEHWMMAMDAQTYMVDDILVKVDRAAMANSLETRVPLLDHRIVEFAWQVPLAMKIRDGQGKWLLREVLYKHVPKALIERPKKGFSIPLGNWLRGPLREWAEALLNKELLEQQGYLQAAPIRRLWQEHLTGKADRSAKLWGVLMFQAWLEQQKS